MKAGYHPPHKGALGKNDLKKQGFYHWPAWRRLRRLALQRDHYLCQHCLKKGTIKTATEVHHIKPIADFPELALDLGNLVSLCWNCHEETKPRGTATASMPARVIRINGSGDKEMPRENPEK